MRPVEKQQSINYALEKQPGNRNCLREQPDVGFNKGLKVTIINVVKELKETKVKEAKEGQRTVSHQIENISEKIEIRKRNQAKMMQAEKYN